MTNGAGFFWVKCANRVAARGAAPGATETAPRAEVEVRAGSVEYVDVGGGKYIEGYTIRLRAQVGAGQTTASLSLLAPAGQVAQMPFSFYVDQTDPRKRAQRFPSEQLAMAERGKQAFIDWAADGVVVLASLAIAQARPDEA